MSERKSERVPVMFEPSLLRRVDDYRFYNRMGSRAKALRHLVEVGLREEPETKKASAQS